jgi:hypothetical protein
MRKWILVAAVSAVVAGAGAWAVAGHGKSVSTESRREMLGRMLDTSPADSREAKLEARIRKQTVRESTLNVGDPDSFGRGVRWLGFVSSRGLVLRRDCTPLPWEDPNQLCMEVDSSQFGNHYAEFRDLGTVTLPARSMNSLLCHWLSPTMGATLQNMTGLEDQTASLTMYPSLTVENEVLNDPALVDPDTGLPLNGRLEVFASGSNISALLDYTEQVQQRLNSTRTCVGGYLTRRTLTDFYGLSSAQAAAFFRKPTTLRLNMAVMASRVESANISYSVRFVGD